MNIDHSPLLVDETLSPGAIPIDLAEARIIIRRWKSLQLPYSLVLEQDSTEGIYLLLRQQNKCFRLSTGSGKPKRFLYTQSLGKTIFSLFPNGQPECEIVYQWH